MHRFVRSLYLGVSALAGFIAVGGVVAPVHAQEAEVVAADDDREEAEQRYDANMDQAARRVFVSASQAFAAGDYEVALARFRQAYELSPRPTLLYNIAATLDRLRRDEEAVEALKAYLEAVPDAPDRTEIEARIRVLEQAIARREAQRTPPAETETEPDDGTETDAETQTAIDTGDGVAPVQEPDDGGGLHPAIAIAVGGAALVAGGLLIWSGLDAKGKDDDLVAYVAERDANGATLAEGQTMLDDAESAAVRTNVLMGVTIALGATAGECPIFRVRGQLVSSFGQSPLEVDRELVEGLVPRPRAPHGTLPLMG